MKLSIRQYGDPALRAKGKRVDKIDNRIRELAMDMIETMHAANGVGLAAQQIGEALQLTVLDISQVEDRPSKMKLNGQDVDGRTLNVNEARPKADRGSGGGGSRGGGGRSRQDRRSSCIDRETCRQNRVTP